MDQVERALIVASLVANGIDPDSGASFAVRASPRRGRPASASPDAGIEPQSRWTFELIEGLTSTAVKVREVEPDSFPKR